MGGLNERAMKTAVSLVLCWLIGGRCCWAEHVHTAEVPKAERERITAEIDGSIGGQKSALTVSPSESLLTLLKVKPGAEIRLRCTGRPYGPIRIVVEPGDSRAVVTVLPDSETCGANKAVITGMRAVTVGRVGSGELFLATINYGVAGVLHPDGKRVNQISYPEDGFFRFKGLAGDSPQPKATLPLIALDPSVRSFPLVGAELAVKTADWLVERRTVVGMRHADIELAGPLTYDLRDGYKYRLYGLPWMLSVPEKRKVASWASETSAGRTGLYVYLPGWTGLSAVMGVLPKLAILTLEGGRFEVRDLIVRDGGGVGLYVNGESAHIANVEVMRTEGDGVALYLKGSALIENTTVRSAKPNGINVAKAAVAIVKDVTVEETGLQDDFSQSVAGINVFGATYGIVTKSKVNNSAYSGIRAASKGWIYDNQVTRSCVMLDDCGAIYTWNRGRVSIDPTLIIEKNRIFGASGLDGEILFGTASKKISAGVYLDYGSNGVQVLNNDITHVRQGVFVGNSLNVAVFGNRLSYFDDCAVCVFGEKDWMKSNDLFTNVVESNCITAPASPNAKEWESNGTGMRSSTLRCR